jgi:steroid delta-isomerase-like uncharacterized protein
VNTFGSNVFMTKSQETTETWLRYIEAWNEHDIEKIVNYVSDDFIYDECPMTMSEPLKGKAEMRRYLAHVFRDIPDFHITLISIDAGTEMGWSESVMDGHIKIERGLLRISRAIHAKVACGFIVEDGKLVKENLYWDRGNTLKQIGKFPAVLEMLMTKAWR